MATCAPTMSLAVAAVGPTHMEAVAEVAGCDQKKVHYHHLTGVQVTMSPTDQMWYRIILLPPTPPTNIS